MTQAPALIRHSRPIASRLLRLGMPMGPNQLLTVPGRTSGLPRTAPVAVVDVDGRRWVVGTFGDVNWVRNLRAAGRAEIRIDGHGHRVTAHELTPDEAAVFFRDTIAAFRRDLPRLWRLGTGLLLRLAAPDVLADPVAAGRRLPVFELRPEPIDHRSARRA